MVFRGQVFQQNPVERRLRLQEPGDARSSPAWKMPATDSLQMTRVSCRLDEEVNLVSTYPSPGQDHRTLEEGALA